MASVGELSRERHKTRDLPAHKLEIAGEDVTPYVHEVSGVYADRAAASGMQLVVSEDLRELTDARVRWSIGYGDELTEYMSGYLQEPVPERYTKQYSATAFGPLEQWGTQALGGLPGGRPGEVWDFSGQTLEQALMRLEISSGGSGNSLTVVRGSPKIDDARFVEETSHLEAGSTMTSSNEYVLTDRPGFRKLAMPRPEPGQADKIVAEYEPADLEAGAFSVSRQTAILYQEVVAFRRDEDGAYEVREVAKVPNRGSRGRRIPKRRTKYLPDFVGSRKEALEAAQRKARELALGAFSFECKVWANPEVLQYSTVRIGDVEVRGGVPHLVIYDALVEEISVSHKLREHHAVLKGHAVIAEERELRRDPFRRSFVTSGVHVPLAPPIADVGLDGAGWFFATDSETQNFLGADSAGMWLDEEAAGGIVGVDETGMYLFFPEEEGDDE